MKQEFAKPVEESFEPIDTALKDSAQMNVDIHFVGIKEIKPAGRRPVYNMEVDVFHNFSVNGGIVVHNCMDDMRYFCATIMAREVRANGV